MAKAKLAGQTTKEKKNCQKGFPCGFSCQAQGRQCRKRLDGQAATFQEWLKMQAGGKSVEQVPTEFTVKSTPHQGVKKITTKGKFLTTKELIEDDEDFSLSGLQVPSQKEYVEIEENGVTSYYQIDPNQSYMVNGKKKKKLGMVDLSREWVQSNLKKVESPYEFFEQVPSESDFHKELIANEKKSKTLNKSLDIAKEGESSYAKVESDPDLKMVNELLSDRGRIAALFGYDAFVADNVEMVILNRGSLMIQDTPLTQSEIIKKARG